MIDDAVIVLNVFDNLCIPVLTICIVRDSGGVPNYIDGYDTIVIRLFCRVLLKQKQKSCVLNLNN